MKIPHRDLAHIASYRLLTEMRLSSLLKRTRVPETLEDIKRLIYDEGHTKLNAYVTKSCRLFESADIAIDAVMPVLQDAWNYFPHRSLNGQSPAERLLVLSAEDAMELDDNMPPFGRHSSEDPFEDEDRLRETT